VESQPAQDNRPDAAQCCPFCGQRLEARAAKCPKCKLAVDPKSVAAVRPLLGPWFLHDPRNPSAPGVSWERLTGLVKRGRLKPDSVVRGPATGGLWRIAADTPSVATLLGLCWSCHAALTAPSALCPQCKAVLDAAHDPADGAHAADGAAIPATVAAAPARAGVAKLIVLTDDAPDAHPEAAEAHADVSGPMSDLISAATAGPPTRRLPYRRGNMMYTVLVLAVVACLIAPILWTTAHLFLPALTGNQASHGDPVLLPKDSSAPKDSTTPQDLPTPSRRTVDLTGNSGPVPGELYPKTRPQPAPAATPQPTATVAEPAPVVAEPVAAPAPLDPAEIQARLKRQAADQYARAQKARADGHLMAAQKILVDMLNSTELAARPAGATDTLKEIQDAIRASTQPEADVSATEIARQARVALDLFAKARALEVDGKYAEAQDVLLKILNTYHPDAWPADAQNRLRAVQDKLAHPPPPPPPAPTTKPVFFGTGDK
jgi:hypothetical protein